MVNIDGGDDLPEEICPVKTQDRRHMWHRDNDNNGDDNGDGDGDDNNDIKHNVQVQHRTVTLPAIRTIASPQYQQVRSWSCFTSSLLKRV